MRPVDGVALFWTGVQGREDYDDAPAPSPMAVDAGPAGNDRRLVNPDHRGSNRTTISPSQVGNDRGELVYAGEEIQKSGVDELCPASRHGVLQTLTRKRTKVDNVPVDVSYVLHDEVYSLSDLIGGIQISIDGERINEFSDEGTLSFLYSWQPAFVGEYLNTDFSSLLSDAKRLARGDVALYDPIENSFSANRSFWVFEPVTETQLRIAYRTRVANSDSNGPPLPTAESARGYLVDRCEFCRATSEAAHDYADDLRAMDAEQGIELLEDFEASLAELGDALETCEETPPELPADD